VAVPPCSLCTTVESLNIDGDDLNFCGKLSVNCSIAGIPIKKDLPIPSCVNITDCRFGCSRGCGTGTCSSTGITCVCPEGYYGPDCSAKLTGTCLSSSAGQSCWSYSVPNCKTVQVGSTEYSLVGNETVELLPCASGLALSSDPRCKLCVFADSLHIAGSNLIGRPVVKQVCGSFTVYTKAGQPTVLTTSSTLGNCAGNDKTDDPTTDSPSSWSTARIILVALVVALVIGVVGIGSYFGYQKYQEYKATQAFLRVPTSSDDMANVALNTGDQDSSESAE